MLGQTGVEAVNLVPANIFLSLDSLIVSMAIVMLGTPRGAGLRPAKALFSDFRLCAAFMVCDGFATLTGLSIHGPLGPALLCAYLVLLLALITRSPLRSAFWAPALFSIDNLLVQGSDLWLDTLTAALASGLFALLGIAIATAIAKSMPARWVHGAALILLMAAICL
jgi:hypothetical protein